MKPIFDLDVYARRRARFLENMDNAVVFLTATPPRIRSNDVEYVYRPSSDILYLTGFEEPHCVLILRTTDAEPHFVLFVQERDEKRERWDGARTGIDGAKEIYGADEAYTIEQFDEETALRGSLGLMDGDLFMRRVLTGEEDRG